MKVTPTQFYEQWNENETCMGEMAAFHVTCEQFDISPDTGWDLVAKYAKEQELKEDIRNAI